MISDVQLRESKALPKYLIIYRIVTDDLASVYAEVNRRIANWRHDDEPRIRPSQLH